MAALKKRHEQGWLQEVAKDLDSLIERIKEAKINGEVTSIGYHGNIVDLWERLAQEYEKTQQKLVDLGRLEYSHLLLVIFKVNVVINLISVIKHPCMTHTMVLTIKHSCNYIIITSYPITGIFLRQ